MGINFNSYPILNKNLINKIGLTCTNTVFSYGENNELYIEQLDNNSFSLKDKKYNWNKEKDNICINKTYKIQNPMFLFGVNGIATEDSVIGIALMWYSYDSKQRGVVKFGKINNQKDSILLTLNHEFLAAQFRGCVTFKIILYVDMPGTKNENEEFLGNKKGLYLGTLVDEKHLYLDGMSSIFPICEIELDDGPLWTVTNLCKDPKKDLFIETISINLNKNNKDYEKLKKDKSLMIEVVSAALICIISDIKINCPSDWANIENNESLDEGSVGAAINYFIDTLDWNFNSIKDLSVSIRNFLTKSLMGV